MLVSGGAALGGSAAPVAPPPGAGRRGASAKKELTSEPQRVSLSPFVSRPLPRMVLGLIHVLEMGRDD